MANDSKGTTIANVIVAVVVIGIGVRWQMSIPDLTGSPEPQAQAVAEQPKKSPCEAAILAQLRNPASATIELLARESNGMVYKVRAQNGFGGYSVEQWVCMNVAGELVAVATGS